eukprot:TRINITY_DN99254_c0_g1_i1.p1 TRINITY_DN99254_c0_g1~~TRINITY_DN99254_c0_g1_i1.p1  ORF type:complete len:287 (-),score=-36.27 TRINITY_DN99254_c0_g1_i1:102-962(-)
MNDHDEGENLLNEHDKNPSGENIPHTNNHWLPDEKTQDFISKELDACNFNRQVQNSSTFLCILQVLFYVVMTQESGFRGSSSTTVAFTQKSLRVNGGAYQDAMYDRYEYWRLVVAIFIHSGFIELMCNTFIQISQCGYINLLFGSTYYNIIYIASGVFGHIVGCLENPDEVTVGSSCSILGVFAAWFVWIIYRWRFIPAYYTWLRNAQFLFVLISLASTLVWSYMRFHNFAKLACSVIIGLLWGILLFSNKKHVETTGIRLGIRIIIPIILILCYAGTTLKLAGMY